jgi:glycosyltransferase involved in cell wall biosynthesis
MATSEEINTLYNILDLYIVSSRLEGGPQAIVECAITKTPIISTDVGVAAEILSKSAIYKNETNYHTAAPDTKFAYENGLKLIIPDGMEPFRKMFGDLIEN